ncbi:hypothetical protein MHK_007611, partial [Candidatus Magnetomorum sp. HK-1]
IFTQGVALGWYVDALSGLRKSNVRLFGNAPVQTLSL